MNSELKKLVSEVGVRDFRPKREERVKFLKNNDRYDSDEDTTMNLDQARRLSEYAESQVSSTGFSSDEEFFDLLERMLNDWPEVEFRFSGMIGSYGYLDGLHILYDGINNSDVDEFEKYCVVHFKESIDNDTMYDRGVTLSDNRITKHPDGYRDVNNDDNLWASPTEFNFYDNNEYPQFGDCLRLWWDD